MHSGHAAAHEFCMNECAQSPQLGGDRSFRYCVPVARSSSAGELSSLPEFWWEGGTTSLPQFRVKWSAHPSQIGLCLESPRIASSREVMGKGVIEPLHSAM